VVGEQPGQLASEDRLVDEQRGVAGGLEPDVALDRRHPQDARQLPQLDLLHRPGRGVAEGVQGAAQPTLGGLEPPAGRPGRPAGAGRPLGQLVEDSGHHGLVVLRERRAGEVLAPGPPGTRAWRCRLAGRGHERGRQHPGGLVLVFAHAAEQDRVEADELAQGREDGGGVGGPHLGRELGLRQGQRARPLHQEHRLAVGVDHHPADPAAPSGVVHGRAWYPGVRPGRAGGRGGAGAGR
jgi:hypothetical protein